MNLKRIFGALLTVLGCAALIYAAIYYVQSTSGVQNVKLLVTFGLLGILFFAAGIGLIKTTKDEA
jgi:hypothetical protein